MPEAQGFLSEWAQDYVRGGVKKDDVTLEYESDPFRNLVGGMLGGGTGEQAITDVKTGKKKEKSRATWDNAGIHQGKLTEMGLTEDSGSEAILGGLSKITEEKEQTVHDRNTELPKATLKAQSEQSDRVITAQGKESDKVIAAGDRRASENMTVLQAQMQQSNNQFMTQMADSKDQRAMELQMRREDMDRRDRRDEKNRRRESIQALIGGLSSLGAAFAV